MVFLPTPRPRILVLGSAFAVLTVLGVSTTLVYSADSATPESLRFFEERVRPILANKCQRCHGDDKQKGGLRLDSLAGILLGGESGAAIEPGKPAESLLIGAINYESFEMPPEGKLPEDEIEVLTKWIEMGAPWPQVDSAKGSVREKGGTISDEDRQYWAFQPIREVAVPQVSDAGWSQGPIDSFIYERLAAAGLSPSPPADPRALLRRLYFDLIGLPPPPSEMEAFLSDPSPAAYAAIVDRLLDSPAYGEKWARHWLDLVRYAESDGFKQDAYRPSAWRYRDYVIRSWNEDKPYDQFIREQLAGDELPESGTEALAATSYLRHWIYEYNQRDVRTQWSNILNDLTDVTAEVFLGLSVGCARCHDHKFDPILQKDYFRLQAFFAPLLPRDDIPFLAGSDLDEYHRKLAEWEQRSQSIRDEMEQLEKATRDRVAEGAINKFPPDIRPMLRKPIEQRSPFEQQLADLASRQVREELAKLDFGAKLKGDDKERWLRLKKELKQLQEARPKSPEMALTVTDVGPVAPVSFIPADRAKTPIAPGFLSVLDPGDAVIDPPDAARSTGRRTALAQWITRPENPLTARVIVNRIWQYHFGQGIVSTSSDFGHLGEAPSHPEMLDWLARWFVEGGWRFKRLHRLLVTSATYQQAAHREPAKTLVSLTSSAPSPAADPMIIDPENRLLWHMPIRRLDAEQIRDAALCVAGELEPTVGGPSVDRNQPRRTIYTKVLRNERDPLLDVFDAPDNFNSTSFRNVTTTPTQALLMINGDWMLKRAAALARRVDRESPGDRQRQLQRAYGLVYGRSPSAEEVESALAFFARREAAETSTEENLSSASFGPFPGREGMALDVKPGPGQPLTLAPDSPSLPAADFTVEATVLLRSLYDDASVRTIVSQWDNDNRHPGWSLGVTSKKSRYEPRNLILQLVGFTKDTAATYEVVASDLRLELNRPYYVAVRVRISDPSNGGVTFFVRDLSSPGSPLQTAQVPHKVVKEYRGKSNLVLGGRDGQTGHRWDGLIDDVRISDRALEADQLLLADNTTGGAESLSNIVAWWRFEPETGILHDATERNNHLTSHGVPSPKTSTVSSVLVDFCHVLLNSNEFLYIE